MLSMMKKRVLVIGAGVSGLTTALCLLQKGFQVTVVAEKFAPDIVSVVAGALWEWPPAVCGHHLNQQSLDRSKQWCMVSYKKFFELAQDEKTGVFIYPVTFYFPHCVESNPNALRKMKELRSQVQGFRHSAALIREHHVNEQLGLEDAYTHLAPMVDTDVYLNWLLRQVCRAGCLVLAQRIDGHLRENEEHLKRQFGVEAIVNCSGLGGRELGDKSLYPLRGVLVRVLNDGISMPLLKEAHCVAHEAGNEQDMIFIAPRGKNRVILGGLVEPEEWSTDISLETYQPIRDMFDRCVSFLPSLQHARLDPNEPVRVGLHPVRRENVRLEREAETCIIHNYGHGGSGVTFSWGCAQEVTKRLEAMLSEER